MDMWMWVIAVLVVALAIIWFVLAGPGMKSATTRHEHHEAEEPVRQPVVDAAAVDAGQRGEGDAGQLDGGDARRAQHGVVHDVAESAPERAVGSQGDEAKASWVNDDVAVEDVEPEPADQPDAAAGQRGIAAAAGGAGLVGASAVGARRVADDEIAEVAVEDAEPEPLSPTHAFDAAAVDAAAAQLRADQVEEPEPRVEAAAPIAEAPAHTFDADALDQACGKLAGAGLLAGGAGIAASERDDAPTEAPEVLDATALANEPEAEGEAAELDEPEVEGVYNTESDEEEIDEGLPPAYEYPRTPVTGWPKPEEEKAEADPHALGDLEHASSVDERADLGSAPHGAGEGSATDAEPVPYVTDAPAETIDEAVAEREEPAVLAPAPQVQEKPTPGIGEPVASAVTAESAKPFMEPEPVADEVEQVWDGPFGPGSADANPDGSGPRGWAIKAARQTKVYLTPDIPVYAAAKANIWFVDEQRAIDAGFRRWDMPK